MHKNFKVHVDAFPDLLSRLCEMPPAIVSAIPISAPLKCIYLLSENGNHLYVGRTKKLKQRMNNHSGKGSDQNQAVLAYKLACEKLGLSPAAYTKLDSRKERMKNPIFLNEFNEQKKRIRSMHLRFIEISEPAQQALFEIYVALVLETPYNDFDTH